MTRRHDSITLRQMLDYSREAVEMCRGRAKSNLYTDRMLVLSLCRLLEIVGEGAKRVTTEYREAHPDIPWRGYAGLRDRLIHAYDKVDFDALWQIVTTDLPALITNLEELLREETGA